MANADIDAIREDFEKQIAGLKKEMNKMSRSLAARAEDVADDAEDALHRFAGQTRGAVDVVSRQAREVRDVARDNPNAATTMLAIAGLGGFLLGVLAVGKLSR